MDMAVVISRLSQARMMMIFAGIANDHDDNEEDDEHLSIEG